MMLIRGLARLVMDADMRSRTLNAAPVSSLAIDGQRVRDESYLVARGVRLLADLGTCPAEPDFMLRAATLLERDCASGAVPFVVERGDGQAVYGCAQHTWAIDLYRWAISTDLPDKQRARILGLLHGYSGGAIRDFEDQGYGRLFTSND